MNRVEIYTGKTRIRIYGKNGLALYESRVDIDDTAHGMCTGTPEEILIAVNAFSLIYDALKGEEGWWPDPDPIDLDKEAARLVLRQMNREPIRARDDEE